MKFSLRVHISLLTVSLLVAGCSAPGTQRSVLQPLPLLTPQSVSPGKIAPAPMIKTAVLPSSWMRSQRRAKGDIQGLNYTQIPGGASFAAAAPDGTLWVLSDQPAGTDKYIWHYAAGTWTNISGLASRISVAPNGTLYAINSGGGAYAYSGGNWSAFGGGCRDLTAAADGSLYVISNAGGADGAIWHNSGGTWTQQPGSGNRLAASWDTRTYTNPGGTITPGSFYVINSSGGIYYLSATGYVQLPGAASAIAAMNGGLFVMAYPTNPNGNTLYYYNLDAPGWSVKGGSGVSVSTDGNTLYVISSSGAIYMAPVTPNAQVLVDASQVGPPISKDLIGAQSPYYLTDYSQPNDANAFASIPLRFTTYGDDYYHWQSNTWCQPTGSQGLPPGEVTNPANPNGTFDQFVTRFAQPDHLDVMIHVPVGTNPTCNGRADSAEAAGWVDYSNNTKGYGIKLWELGLYPADADNGDFGNPPYMANSPATYASIANNFYSAMKAKDPTIKVGVMISPVMGGPGPAAWDTTLLANATSDFVVFPEAANSAGNPGNPSDNDLLFNSVPFMHGTFAGVRAELNAAGKPNEPVIVDVLDGNDFQTNTQQTDSIVTALYFGMAIGEIMNAGFTAVAEGYGGCGSFTSVAGEYGSGTFAAPYLISNGASCPVPDGTILPQGRAYQLAAQFAVAGEHVLAVSVSSQPNVRAYAATQGAGYAVLLFNLDQNNATTPSLGIAHPSKAAYSATTTTYGKAQYDSGFTIPPVTASLGTVGNTLSVTLPPWSMTVVQLR